MLIINPSVEILDNDLNSTKTLSESIEIAARTCYKSEDKIQTGSDIELLKKLVHRNHNAMLEFGKTIIIEVHADTVVAKKLLSEKFINSTERYAFYIFSGSARTWRDYIAKNIDRGSSKEIAASIMHTYPEFEYMLQDKHVEKIRKYTEDDDPALTMFTILNSNDLDTDEERLKHIYPTVKMICDRGVSHELVRHRLASFAQESTRYVNYGKDEHLTFIKPLWLDIPTGIIKISRELIPKSRKELWINGMLNAEYCYNKDLELGGSPQEARSVLPNAIKTEILTKTSLEHWNHILAQRDAAAAHPQMRELAEPLHKMLKDIYGNIVEPKLMV